MLARWAKPAAAKAAYDLAQPITAAISRCGGCSTAYPAMARLVDEPSFGKLLTVELWLSCIYAGYNGAMVVHLTETVPVAVRTAGFSLAYSLATTIGGSTPVIVICRAHGYRWPRASHLSAPGLPVPVKTVSKKRPR